MDIIIPADIRFRFSEEPPNIFSTIFVLSAQNFKNLKNYTEKNFYLFEKNEYS
jgi:hypothetical protein